MNSKVEANLFKSCKNRLLRKLGYRITFQKTMLISSQMTGSSLSQMTQKKNPLIIPSRSFSISKPLLWASSRAAAPNSPGQFLFWIFNCKSQISQLAFFGLPTRKKINPFTLESVFTASRFHRGSPSKLWNPCHHRFNQASGEALVPDGK